MNKLVLVTGLPGSGKSYLAAKLAKEHDGVVLSTDDFFMKDGGYKWTGSFISDAHKWNQGRCFLEMFKGTPLIIIDNTNLSSWQMEIYVDAAVRHGYDWDLVEPKTSWKNDPIECAKRNVHLVSVDKIREMLTKAEPAKEMLSKLKAKFNGKK